MLVPISHLGIEVEVELEGDGEYVYAVAVYHKDEDITELVAETNTWADLEDLALSKLEQEQQPEE
jgi:hypothetical protein